MICLVKTNDLRNDFCYDEVKKFMDITYTDDVNLINKSEIIILPITGVNDKGIIKGSSIALNQLINPFTKIIVCYQKTLEIEKYSKVLDVDVIELSKDKEFVYENSYLTAEGLLSIIIQEIDYKLKGTKILIAGYGNSGMAIGNLLKKIDCSIYYYSRNEIPEKIIVDLNNINGFKIIINTIPAKIFNEKVLSQMNNDQIIFDITSEPYGVDVEYANRKKIKTIITNSIPAKYYPYESGIIYGRSIIKALWEA